MRIFAEWCEVRGLSALPTVCAFLEDQVATLCPSSVRRRLYAIRNVHRLLRLPDLTWDEDINLTLRRIRRAKLSRPKQAKGLTHWFLDRCLAAQPDNPWGLRNRAMIALGYDFLTRRSELVALRSDDVEFRSDGTLRAIIGRSKADPFGMGRIAFSSAALLSWCATDSLGGAKTSSRYFAGFTKASRSIGPWPRASSNLSSRRLRQRRAHRREM